MTAPEPSGGGIAGAGRALDAVRVAYGAGLLLLPAGALERLARASLDTAAVRVARVLGARELLQAALLTASPSPRRRLAGAAVDALHAASMLAVARWSHRSARRTLARRNARTAAMLAVGGCIAAGLRFSVPLGGHQR
jgi:uncharacterized membrane protein (DUF4010 family)